MTALTWKRLADGDLLCNQHPIVLTKPISRRVEDPGWQVSVPDGPDSNFTGGWRWAAVVDYRDDPQPQGPVDFWSMANAKKWVADNVDYILTQACDAYDGDAVAAHAERHAGHEAWLARVGAPAVRVDEIHAMTFPPPSAEARRLLQEAALAARMPTPPRPRRRSCDARPLACAVLAARTDVDAGGRVPVGRLVRATVLAEALALVLGIDNDPQKVMAAARRLVGEE